MTPYNPIPLPSYDFSTATRKSDYTNPGGYGDMRSFGPTPLPQMLNQTSGAFPATNPNLGSIYGATTGAFDFDAFSGTAWDSLKNVGGSALDALKGQDGSLWGGLFGSTSKDGMKTNGLAGTALGLFDSISRYNQGNEQMGLFRDNLNSNKEQFSLNFNNQAQLLDERRNSLYARDVAEAKLNNRPAPKEPVALRRA